MNDARPHSHFTFFSELPPTHGALTHRGGVGVLTTSVIYSNPPPLPQPFTVLSVPECCTWPHCLARWAASTPTAAAGRLQVVFTTLSRRCCATIGDLHHPPAPPPSVDPQREFCDMASRKAGHSRGPGLRKASPLLPAHAAIPLLRQRPHQNRGQHPAEQPTDGSPSSTDGLPV